MKLSSLDSREIANKGADCALYNPKTGQMTGAVVTMLGADSAVYKNKLKELQERHRLDGKPVTPEAAEADTREILAACAIGWKGVEDDDGKPIPFTADAIRSALEIPEVYKQLAEFSMRRANFLPSDSAN